jgi:hypothetical protein
MASKPNNGRFQGPSDAIDIQRLERETRTALYIGILVAIGFHAALGSWFTYRRTGIQVTKPLTMGLIIKPPRLQHPLVISKQSARSREVEGTVPMYEKPFRPVDIQDIELPDILRPVRIPKIADLIAEPGVLMPPVLFTYDIEVPILRIPDLRISMREEMIALDDLDYGRYKAMVIQDPYDRQAVRGFVHIPTVWAEQLRPPDDVKRGILHLSEALIRYTDINAVHDTHIYLSDRRLHDLPFIYITTDEMFELTTIELENFGTYLRNGGFAVLDNGLPMFEYSKAEASLKQALRDALGYKAIFEPIPEDHPLYHCFFPFEDGPPIGSEIGMNSTISNPVSGEGARNVQLTRPVHYLEGVWINNRLVAIYSDKGYALRWREFTNNNPQLKMGVNMVVFALTQQGGIAQRRMDMFSTSR